MKIFENLYPFKEIFLNKENKLLTGLSFFIVGLISLHFIFYLNFFNFYGSWINKESKLVTVQITPKKNEKRVPLNIQDLIIKLYSDKKYYSNIEIKDDTKIRNDLGLNNLSSFSKLRVPFIFQINLQKKEYSLGVDKLKQVLEERKFEIYYHRDDLQDVYKLIYKVNLFIFIFGFLNAILFFFFLTLLLKISLISNLKFLEIIQIMGADNKKISFTLSFILIKKILPGSFLAIFFTSIFSILISSLFGLPGNLNEDLEITNSFFNYFIYLLLLLIFVLISLFCYFVIYLIYFLEKRFFIK